MSALPIPQLDRPLPQNPDAERAVLGAILVNNQALWRVVTQGLVAEDFLKDAHRAIYAAILRMADAGQAIELLTVKEDLAAKGELGAVGGVAYVSALLDVNPDVANVERYAAIVKEKATLRRLIAMSNRVMGAALDPPGEPAAVLSLAEEQLYAIASRQVTQGFAELGALTRRNLEAIERAAAAGAVLTGIPTGYDRWNELTQGLQRQDLVIVAGRPSMGKTALAMNVAEAIAIPGMDGGPKRGLERLYRVGVFSLEMSREQIALRMLAAEANVSSHLIRAGVLSQRNWQQLAEASSRMARATVSIDDTPGIDPMTLRAKARRLKGEMGLDLLIVDYLQLMSVKGKVESRQQEISQISRALKAIAKELDVPLIALSQLSRRPEQRKGDHRPQLADLRESGSIEQDADVVAFIYRDEVYNKESEEKGVAEIIIGKQRNGPIGDFKLVFRNDITKFFNYEPQPEVLG